MTYFIILSKEKVALSCNRDRFIDRKQDRNKVGGGLRGGGIEQKEKGLMDMDNSVVTMGKGYKGTKL